MTFKIGFLFPVFVTELAFSRVLATLRQELRLLQ